MTGSLSLEHRVAHGVLAALALMFLSGPSRDRESPEADDAGEALRWRRLSWVDERGVIPKDAVGRAMRQRRSLAAATRASRGLGPLAVIPGVPLDWASPGPTNVGGRTRALLVDPRDPTIVWAGSVSGGLYKSTDAGSTWAVQAP